MVKTEDYERAESTAVSAGKSSMSLEFSNRRVGKGGLFAEVRQNQYIYPQHYQLIATDGVGTKLFLSQFMDRYDTVGQDLVAMCVNDLATFGRVHPDTISIYFAMQRKAEEEKMGEIVKGIDNALKQCVIPGAPWNINYGKHETASVDEMVSGPVPDYGYDIACVVTAFIRKPDLPTFSPKEGDAIIGLESSGLHSNGYTAARHVLLTSRYESRKEFKDDYRGRYLLTDKILDSEKTLGEVLLEPTTIYFRPMHAIASEVPAFGINITGYGLKNFNRFGKNVTYEITDPLEPHPIHLLVMREGNYKPETAYEKLNMGLGFAIITEDRYAARALEIANNAGYKGKIIGHVASSDDEKPCVLLHLGSGSSKTVHRLEGYG